jgi:hypothetical protein
MASPSWENLDDFLEPDDEGGFATIAVFTLSDGTIREVPVIFDDDTIDAHSGSFHVDVQGPKISGKAVDLAATNMLDVCLVNGTIYDVKDRPQLDGTGWAYILLAPQPPTGAR